MMYLKVIYISECVLPNQETSINSKLKTAESWYYSQTYKLRNYTQKVERAEKL